MSEFENDNVPNREPGCLFCEEILDQEDGFVLDTLGWRVIVSRDQGYLGRCMVIPRRHLSREAELTEEEVLEFHYLKVQLEDAFENAFGASLSNWTELGNDAFQEEDPKPHLHHHVRPRYSQPVEFAGRNFTDPKWGKMYDSFQRWNVDNDPDAEGFKNKVANAIRLAIVKGME